MVVLSFMTTLTLSKNLVNLMNNYEKHKIDPRTPKSNYMNDGKFINIKVQFGNYQNPTLNSQSRSKK